MLLTERAIRQLIYNILLEGVREDADALRTLLTDAPEALSQFEPLSMKPKWVNWLADRYVRNKYPADDTLEDALPVVVSFAAADAAISQKYGSNPQFAASVDTTFPPGARKWKNPADAAAMSTADMDTLLTIYKRPKDKLGIDREDTSWKNDEVGTFGPWKLYFPRNQQNSINIAGADPETHKSYTTWCTARTAGSNLFNNYATRGVMLFYAINAETPPKDPESRISLGFIRGKLEAGGQYGGITVNAVNKGLKDDDLESIFGGYYTSIIARAEAVVAEHGGVHPIGAELDAAAKDPVKFNSMLRGLSDAEAADLANSIFVHNRKLSPEVEAVAANHKSAGVRKALLRSEILSNPVLMKLAGDTDSNVRATIAARSDLPEDILVKLAEDDDSNVRTAVASRHDVLPKPVLMKLAVDNNSYVRGAIANRVDLLDKTLMDKFAGDTDSNVRAAIAARSDLPEDILNHLQDKETDINVLTALLRHRHDISEDFINRMANLKNLQVRSALAANSKTSPEILEKLSNIKSATIDSELLRNANTPGHVLRKIAFKNKKTLLQAVRNETASADLIRDIVKYCDSIEIKRSEKSIIYLYTVINSNAPEDVLRHAADVFSRSGSILARIARNPNAPEDLLRKVANSKANDLYNSIPAELLNNPKTPDDVIRKLARHTVESVRRKAINKLRERGIAESRRLAHRILREIKRRGHVAN